MNFLDYLDWRGDLTMAERPFNDIDNLILSELAYVKMDKLVSTEISFDTTISQLLAKYRVARYDQEDAHNNPLPLLEKAAGCARFKDIRAGAYLNRFDKDNVMQISAVTFRLDENTLYVAFRGTDHTMTGWREDFNFGYLSETPGQAEAASYLKRICTGTGCRVYVGGHSKGGNFAVYAGVSAEETIRRKQLLRLFSNDGPGFKKSFVNSEAYLSMTGKITKIVPEGSIIGMLLFGSETFRIIKAEGKGLEQHSPYRWQVTKDAFVPAGDLTYTSGLMDEAFDKWVEELDTERRRIVISTLFDAIEAAGYNSINELLENKLSAYNAVAKATKQLDESERKSAMASLKRLAGISKDILWDDAKQKFRLQK